MSFLQAKNDLPSMQHLSWIISDYGFIVSVTNKDSLRRKISGLYTKIQALKKSKKTKKVEEILSAKFLPPVPTQGNMSSQRMLEKEQKRYRVLEDSYGEVCVKLDTAHSVIDELQTNHASALDDIQCRNELSVQRLQQIDLQRTVENENLKVALEAEKKVSDFRSGQISNLERDIDRKCEKLKSLDVRNTNRQLKRQRETIGNLREEVKKRKVEILNLSERCDILISEKDVLSEKLDKLKAAHVNNLKKKSKIKMRLMNVLSSFHNVSSLEIANKRQEEALHQMEEYVAFLESDKAAAPKSISSFQDGKYSSQMREVCMRLLTECSISIKKLPQAIEIVMTQLAGANLDRLPSSATLSRILAEANIVAHTHVATEILSNADPTAPTGNVLHQDATTKHHKHIEGMQATLADGRQLSLGLRQVAGGDSHTYEQAFDDIVNDLSRAYTKLDDEDARRRIITSFKAFMNDRCAVNGVFTSQIEKLRTTLLPAVVANFESLQDEEKSEIFEMGHFACKLHLLSNFATACKKGAATIEDCLIEGRNPFSKIRHGSSEAISIVMTCAKAFAERGCDKSGVTSWFEAFLHGRGRKNEVKTFLGHRFNILFSNAAAIYHHRSDIDDFLTKWPSPNNLLKCILFDIKEDKFMCIVRALGIIGKILTEPLQKILVSGISTGGKPNFGMCLCYVDTMDARWLNSSAGGGMCFQILKLRILWMTIFLRRQLLNLILLLLCRWRYYLHTC